MGGYITPPISGHQLMVSCLPSKQTMWVRFPLPALYVKYIINMSFNNKYYNVFNLNES